MRTPRSLILAGASAPLILSDVASAGFTGLKAVMKDITGFEDLVAMVVNLYATFSDVDGDGIGDGAARAGFGVPQFRANISVRDGEFFQATNNPNNFGRTAPPAALVPIFPSLSVDTFLTIGLKIVPIGVSDTTALTPTFPLEGQPPGQNPDGSWTNTRLQINDGAWFAFDPVSTQTRPGNHDNPPTQALLGQFSVAAGGGPNMGVFGSLLIKGQHADGTAFVASWSFHTQLPVPSAIALLGTAGVLGCRRLRRDRAHG